MSAPRTRKDRPSSTAFSAELRIDSNSRLAIVIAALILYASGGLLLLTVDLPLPAVLTLAASSFATGLFDCRRFCSRQAGIDLLRVFPGGDVRVSRYGGWFDARLAPGCVVVRRWAWLRVRGSSGDSFRCFLRAGCQRADDWRRFLVISRHIGADS